MSGPFAPDVHGPHLDNPPVLIPIASPCCGVTSAVEHWQVRYALDYTAGRISIRCGSIDDAGGWRRLTDARAGCGQLYHLDLNALLGG
jgi:hypothetical protein